MRFRRKKGQEEDEVVSGDVMPEASDPSSWAVPADAAVTEDAQDDTVDLEAVAPATAAGGAGRADGDPDPDATVEYQVVEEPAAVAATGDDAEDSRAAAEEAEQAAGAEADRRAEEARLADEEAKRAAQAEAEARAGAEEAAEAQREADEKAREASAAARDERAAAEVSTSVSGAGITSPGLGSDVSPGAAAAANAEEREQPAASDDRPAGAPVEGPLAPVLSHPAVQKKPELLVVGGLAAGFVVAKLLKAMGSDS
jgi:hypothetical protein